MNKAKISLKVGLVDGAEETGVFDDIRAMLDDTAERLANDILDLGADLVTDVDWETDL